MNITKKLVSIIIIIAIVLCSVSYADDETENAISDQNTGENTTTGATTTENNTTSDTKNEESNENANQNQGTANETSKETTTTTTNNNTTKKSSNASLSYLAVEPNDFTGFKPDVTSYNVVVENNVTAVSIKASPKDGAVFSVNGNKNLKVGKNTVTITVTSADKTNTKKYYIYVTRKEKEEEKEEEKVEEKVEEKSEKEIDLGDGKVVKGLSKLSIEGIKLSPEFKSDIYEYTANYKGDSTTLNILTTAAQEGSTVEIIGNENLENGDNLINILVTDSEGNIYTYQITLKKNYSENKLFNGQISNETLMAIVIGAGVVVLLIIIILISRKVKKSKKRISKEPLEEIPIIENDIDEEAERIAFVNSILQTNTVKNDEEEKPYVQDSWFKKEEVEEDIKEDIEEDIEEKPKVEEDYNGLLIYEPEKNYNYDYEEKEVVKNKRKKKRAKGKRFK